MSARRLGGARESMHDVELSCNPGHGIPLHAGDESDSNAVASGAPGTSDAVHVGVVVGGRIEVDHVRDPRHIDAASRDVGGDERVDVAGLEVRERLLALALRAVPVDCRSHDAVGAESFDETVGATLGAHEHERELTFAGQLPDEDLDAVLTADRDEAVLDLARRAVAGVPWECTIASVV